MCAPSLPVALQASGFRAAYDEAGELGVYGSNLSVIWAPIVGAQPLFDFRAEATLLKQEFLDGGDVESVRYGGHYVQLSRRVATAMAGSAILYRRLFLARGGGC